MKVAYIQDVQLVKSAAQNGNNQLVCSVNFQGGSEDCFVSQIKQSGSMHYCIGFKPIPNEVKYADNHRETTAVVINVPAHIKDAFVFYIAGPKQHRVFNLKA